MINELDLRHLWKELDDYESQLEKEAKNLQDIWVNIADLKRINDEDMNNFYKLPEFDFLEPDSPILINIGGQLFETNVDTLVCDPFSLLAALCRKESPISCSSRDGSYYFDRDWWIFRHIMAYLRSGVLPFDMDTLKELYTEASFYRIESLKKAIENIPLDQISR